MPYTMFNLADEDRPAGGMIDDAVGNVRAIALASLLSG